MEPEVPNSELQVYGEIPLSHKIGWRVTKEGTSLAYMYTHADTNTDGHLHIQTHTHREAERKHRELFVLLVLLLS